MSLRQVFTDRDSYNFLYCLPRRELTKCVWPSPQLWRMPRKCQMNIHTRFRQPHILVFSMEKITWTWLEKNSVLFPGTGAPVSPPRVFGGLLVHAYIYSPSSLLSTALYPLKFSLFNQQKAPHILQWDRVRTGLKITWIKRAFLKSPWKLNMPLKVLENHSLALKSPWIQLFSVRLSTVDRELNQYKIVAPLFGAEFSKCCTK